MKNAIFIAWHDVRYQLRQSGTIVWLFVMPPIFFYFIGTVTTGFSGTIAGASSAAVVVVANEPGFLQEQINLRLTENDFVPEWRTEVVADADGNLPDRVLTFGDNLSDQVVAGGSVAASYETSASSISRQYEAIRMQRGLYTVLADVVAAASKSDSPLSAEALSSLNAETRIWQLDVSTAGQRQEIPSGFDQAIPGIVVMFTLLVLLTSGSSMLVIERTQGLLRRLASAPMTRRPPRSAFAL